MRTFQLVMAGISIFLLFSTLIRGLWIRFAGESVTDRVGAVQFHMLIGIVTALFVSITLGTVFIKK